MRKVIVIIIIILLVAGVALVLKNKVGPVSIPDKEEIVENSPQDPLTKRLSVPEGFSIHIFASDITGARDMELGPDGRIIVSQTREGKILSLEDTDNDSKADDRKTIAENLDKPHGLAFDCPIDNRNLPCYLYVAEHSRLGRYTYNSETASLSSYTKLLDLESSLTDSHFTRSLLFLPPTEEHILLISVGSSCNVCHEDDSMRGKIMAYDTKTKTLTEYARGLRNSVFMTLDPVSGKVFATEMGRDSLGDNLPPDEVNIIEKDKNYGWPICYGKNIHDTVFDKNTYIRNPCMEPFETPSFVDLQAHSAPLGLSFVPEEGWPEEYWYDLLVAYHGSWNRSVPTGYKIVRLKLDSQGRYTGTEDFVTGWFTPEGTKLGRPVDVMTLPGGTIYISDDVSNLIYRLERR